LSPIAGIVQHFAYLSILNGLSFYTKNIQKASHFLYVFFFHFFTKDHMSNLIKLKQKKSYKYKAGIPVTIALPKAQMDNIKNLPREALSDLKNGGKDPADWYTICFRIRSGYTIAKEVYTEEAVVAMREVLDRLLSILNHYTSTDGFKITEDDFKLIEIGLDYVDQMSDETTSRVQLSAFEEAFKYLSKILKNTKTKS